MATLSVRDITASEADGFVDIVVSLDAPATGTVSVGYAMANDSAANGSDYTYAEGTLAFGPGEVSKTVRVALVNGTTVEGPENFSFFLRNPVNATLARAVAMVQIVDNDTIVDRPELFVRDVVVDEGAGTASFVVRLGQYLGNSAGSTITVNYATQDGTASAGQDYVARSGTLTFAPGESAKTVVVDLLDDTLAEAFERFSLVLSSPVNAGIGDGRALAEIGASDGTGSAQPRIGVADVSAGEAEGFVDLVVSLHAPSTSPISVGYAMSNDSAANGSDYRYSDDTLTFAPGETTKSVRIQIVNDANAEGPESFHFFLRSAVNATIGRDVAMVQIIDNDTVVDTPELFVRDVVIDEGAGTASFVVRLGQHLGNSANSTITVGYATKDATAVAGQDYVAASGTLAFAPGESAKTVVVDLIDDALAEPLERFNLVLSGPVNAAIGDGLAIAEIGASDGTGSAQPRIGVADVSAGEAEGFVDLVVSLHAPSTSPISVGYAMSNDSAANGSDYRYHDGTLTFAPGETSKPVRVQIVNDANAEGPESFYFFLRSAVNATIGRDVAMVQIIDNVTVVDTPELFVRDVLIDEKAGTASFVVRLGQHLGNSVNSTITVGYATQDATAIAGQDYVALGGTLAFAPGESAKTVVVDLLDDALAEPLERFNLVLSSPVNAAIGDGRGVAEIGLSDGPGSAQPRISVADVLAGEADGFMDLVVGLHAPSASPVTVGYAMANGSAANGSDYRYSDGTLTFAPGETSKSVRVQIVADLAVESGEAFSFFLRSPTNATIARSTATVLITDNDNLERSLLSHGRSDDLYDILSAATDFIEEAGGGLDIVRAPFSYTLPAHLEGLYLSGSAVNATGNELANVLRGTPGNNTLNGLNAIDTAIFAAHSSQFTQTGTIEARTVTTPMDGTDALLSIERLRFADTILASDTTPGGNTYAAFAMFNAGFNRAPDAAELGRWTAQRDQLGTAVDLAQAMIHFYAPGVPNDALVTHLWSTIVGGAITPGDLATYVGLIDSGTFTQASLLEFVSTHPFNTVELVGMVGQTINLDLSFFPLPG